MMSSWDPYFKRRITLVYVSPLVAVLCGVVLLTAIALAFNPHLFSDLFLRFTPAPATDLRGEWVGPLEVYRADGHDKSTLVARGAIRFTLGVQDSILRNYGGPGEIHLIGQSAQPIEVRKLSLAKDPAAGNFETAIWLAGYKPDSAGSDFVSGGYKGRFAPGSMTISTQYPNGFIVESHLVKGSDSDYDRFFAQSQLNDSQGQ
jgi:hypothetical protein